MYYGIVKTVNKHAEKVTLFLFNLINCVLPNGNWNSSLLIDNHKVGLSQFFIHVVGANFPSPIRTKFTGIIH